jgi:hypothetical protein
MGDVGPEDAVKALAELASQLGVEVRIEPFELRLVGKGGLCRIDGRPVVLIDESLAALEQAGVLGEALGGLLSRERPALLVPPELRSYLRSGHAPVAPLLRPRPIARART